MLWLWNKSNSGVIIQQWYQSTTCHNSCLMRFSPAAHLPACCQSAHSSALSSVCRLHALVHALAALASMNDAISISRNSAFIVTFKTLIHWTLVQLESRWVCETISPFSAFDHSFDSRDLPLIPFSAVVWRPFLVHSHLLNIVFVIVLYQILWDSQGSAGSCCSDRLEQRPSFPQSWSTQQACCA